MAKKKRVWNCNFQLLFLSDTVTASFLVSFNAEICFLFFFFFLPSSVPCVISLTEDDVVFHDRNDFNIAVLKAFVNLHEFSDMILVQALR